MRFLSTLAASALGTLIALGVLLLFGFFFIFALTLSGDKTPTVSANSVLVIPMQGSIPERAADDPFAEAFLNAPKFDLRDVTESLQKAANDDRIQAVWIQTRGVTGSWASLEEVRAALEAFREASGKPIIASSEDYAMAEKDYYVASAADSVFMGPVTNFVWDGFRIQSTFFAGTLDKIGVDVEVVRAGEYKSAAESLTRSGFSEPNREQYQAIVETFNDTFKRDVAASRGLSPDDLEQIADEDPILLSDVAIERGLIDGHRYYDQVVDVFRGILGLDDGASVSTIEVGSYKRVPASETDLQFTGEGNVAIVYGEGSIVPGESTEDGSQLGSESFIKAIRSARESSNAKAVVVRINSPGGSASASEAMWREIRMTADEKPVIISMGNLAASGGYYMAAGADSIFANATTLTGSIGVIGTFFNTQELFNDRLGVTFDEVRTSPFADFSVLQTEPVSDAERQMLEGFIAETYDTFLQRVADARGMDVSAVDEVAQGRVWTGRDALSPTVGLVDRVGTLDDAIAAAGKAAGLGDGPFRTQVLPRPKTFLERLNSELGGQTASLWMQWTSTELERKVVEKKRFLSELLDTHGTAQARLPVQITVE